MDAASLREEIAAERRRMEESVQMRIGAPSAIQCSRVAWGMDLIGSGEGQTVLDALLFFAQPGDFLAYLTSCDWCLSIWVAPWPSVAVIVWPDNRAILAGLLALTASALTGLLAVVEGRLDR